MSLFSSNAAAVVLADGLYDMGVDVEHAELGEVVARLVVRGERRLLLLDSSSPPEDLCWAMTEALGAVTFGASAAASAHRPRPRLRSVG